MMLLNSSMGKIYCDLKGTSEKSGCFCCCRRERVKVDMFTMKKVHTILFFRNILHKYPTTGLLRVIVFKTL